MSGRTTLRKFHLGSSGPIEPYAWVKNRSQGFECTIVGQVLRNPRTLAPVGTVLVAQAKRGAREAKKKAGQKPLRKLLRSNVAMGSRIRYQKEALVSWQAR